MKFPLDGHHEFDLLFLRHYAKVLRLVREFQPERDSYYRSKRRWNIRGPDGSHPWRASSSFLADESSSICPPTGDRLLSSWPANVADKLAAAAEFGSFHAAARFYKIPRLLFAPNRELVELLEKTTGKPCFLMSHSVNTEAFSPAFRERSGGPFQIGYVGRLTPEKTCASSRNWNGICSRQAIGTSDCPDRTGVRGKVAAGKHAARGLRRLAWRP